MAATLKNRQLESLWEGPENALLLLAVIIFSYSSVFGYLFLNLEVCAQNS